MINIFWEPEKKNLFWVTLYKNCHHWKFFLPIVAIGRKKIVHTYFEKHGRGFHEWKVNQKVRILLLNIRKTIILSPFSPSVLDEIWIFNLLLDNIIINVYIHTSYYHYRKKHTENSILFIVSDFLKMFTFFSV